MTRPAEDDRTAPPRWDMTSFFPAFSGEEHTRFEETLAKELDALRARSEATAPLAADNRAEWAAILADYEKTIAKLSHLGSYVGCLASADGSNESYQLAEGRLTELRSKSDKLRVELRRGLGRADDALFASLVDADLSAAGHALARLRLEAKQSMSPDLEGLTSDLGMFGIMGWGRLYDTISASLSFEMKHPDGRTERVPMAQRRSLMSDADPRVRREAFDAGNRSWSEAAPHLAQALNHIAGTRHNLNARRGVGHFLDVALHQADISRATLDAMMTAIVEGAPLVRRGLRLKAAAMGKPAVHWSDLEAPFAIAGGDDERIAWADGVAKVRAAFGGAYPKLADHFDAMLSRRWIEAEPRDGKRPGAFCTGSQLHHESRVYMTYQGSYGDVSTLAHEVGHAFHHALMRDVRPLAGDYPMTLAETASTFAEAILVEGLLADPSLAAPRRAALLGEMISDAAAFLLDVPTRFLFEKRFYEERLAGEVPATRLSELMVEAQREMFGDSLAEGGEDPLFWASKLHFFIPDTTFYNFPYSFGYLLSRGLYATFAREGASFLPRYEALLRESGEAPAHVCVKRTLGIDLETPEFWRASLATIAAPLTELETYLGRRGEHHGL